MKREKNVKMSKGGKPGIGYTLFKGYVKLIHNLTYYRKFYVVDKENIPQNCPLMVVSDHQNSLNDALGLLYAINSRGNRKIRAITRADAFDIPILGTIMHGLGLLPAFRISYGVENLSNNTHAFNEASDELLRNGTVIIYPESGHQDKRWLGKFTYGYLRLAFEAAEKSNFEQEIFILPSCNHYSGYVDEKEDILIKFGKPISIAPYYEQYKTKPRTAQRELNEVVRRQVSELMLDIQDLENYTAIDFLRETYGKKYAASLPHCDGHGSCFNPENLADKLITDKQFVAELEELKSTNAQEIQSVYDQTRNLDEQLNRLKINDKFFDKKISGTGLLCKIFLHVLLFPLYLIACISNAPVIYLPKIINRKINDIMLHATFKLALGILIGIPLTNIIVFFAGMAITDSLPVTLAYMICLPFLFIFAVYFGKTWKSCTGQMRFLNLLKQNKLSEIISLRQNIHKTLDYLLTRH